MDVSTSKPSIEVKPLCAGEEAEWEHFLGRSPNATLFHDLRFLAYHPVDRFRFHHLTLRRAGKLIALLPGGISFEGERPTFSSPLGASIGGFALAPNLRADTVLAVIEALQLHARRQFWAHIEITLPPACYSFETTGTMQFALFCCGFKVVHRWLCHMVQLETGSAPRYERIFRQNQITSVRAARRKGMSIIENGPEGVEDFLGLLQDTYQRHGIAPTHAPDEIRDLLRRLPDRIRIYFAMLDGVSVAGLLVFRLTAGIAYTFYICSSAEHAGEHGPAFLVAELLDRLHESGVRYLDLGPSASDQRFNKGVAFFKEGLGASGQCRDRWRWDTDA